MCVGDPYSLCNITVHNVMFLAMHSEPPSGCQKLENHMDRRIDSKSEHMPFNWCDIIVVIAAVVKHCTSANEFVFRLINILMQ